MIGERYGRLTVLAEGGSNRHGKRLVLCRCECGTERRMMATKVRHGQTRSCGCVMRAWHMRWSRATFGRSSKPPPCPPRPARRKGYA